MTVAHREPQAGAVSSARRARGQVILCQGCCYGRTDRGFPEVPVDRIKAAWKSGRLNRMIQLTVSGSVGGLGGQPPGYPAKSLVVLIIGIL